MKKLTYNRYEFFKDLKTNRFIFKDLDDEKLRNLFLSVIEKYKPPTHVNPIFIYQYKTLEEYDKGLIYVGYDKTNYLQYFYGKEYVNNRNIKRDNTIKKMVFNIEKYTNTIKLFLKKKDELYYNFACALLLELNFFIRTGKTEYDTVGLLTLKNKNVKETKNGIEISFVGKKQVSHSFTIDNKNNIFKYIQNIIKNNKGKSPNDLFFNISEANFYNMMQQSFDGSRLKDFRTYGVNKIFIENLKQVSDVDTPKKVITKVLEKTASTIGHTKSICKSSYLSKYLYDKLINMEKEEFILLIKKLKNSQNPIFYIYDQMSLN